MPAASFGLVSLAEWSKAPDLSSGSREGAWVRTPQLTHLSFFFGTFLTAGCVKTLPTARLELAIFGLGDRRLIHWATRAAYIRGGETMICQKALPLQVRLVVSCQHLSRLYNLTFSKLHLA